MKTFTWTVPELSLSKAERRRKIPKDSLTWHDFVGAYIIFSAFTYFALLLIISPLALLLEKLTDSNGLILLILSFLIVIYVPYRIFKFTIQWRIVDKITPPTANKTVQETRTVPRDD